MLSPDGLRVAFLRVAHGDGSLGTPSVYVARLGSGRARRVRRGGELPIGSTFRSWRDLAWQPLP